MSIGTRIKFALAFLFLPASMLRAIAANLIVDPDMQAFAKKTREEA